MESVTFEKLQAPFFVPKNGEVKMKIVDIPIYYTLVRLGGFEPPVFSLGVRCFIQLSYNLLLQPQ